MSKMKRYEIQVLANQTIYVSAKNQREARKKATQMFKRRPGKLEMYFEDISWRYYGEDR